MGWRIMKFNPDTMKEFIKTDRLLKLVFNDLSKRNRNMSTEQILEVVFNSYVLFEPEMEAAYKMVGEQA